MDECPQNVKTLVHVLGKKVPGQGFARTSWGFSRRSGPRSGRLIRPPGRGSNPLRMDAGAQVAAWEGTARAFHDATGIGAPVDAFRMARAVGVLCIAGPRGKAGLEGDVLFYDASARLVRQHGLVSHEVAHRLLRLHGEADTEPAANYTSGALMLPGSPFDRDLRDTAWNLEQLRVRHPNASAEMIARRVTQRREAVVSIIDQGRLRARVASPWLEQPRQRLTAVERELADAAIETGQAQRANDLLSAWPLFDGAHRRVIVVAEAQQLEMRF